MKTIPLAIGALVLIGGSVYAYMHWAQITAQAKTLGAALNLVNKENDVPATTQTAGTNIVAPTAASLFDTEMSAAKMFAQKHPAVGNTEGSLIELNKLIDGLKNSKEKIMNASLQYQIPMRYIILYAANLGYISKYNVSAVDLTSVANFNLGRLDAGFGVTSGRDGGLSSGTGLAGRG